jgi:hypothetical protein
VPSPNTTANEPARDGSSRDDDSRKVANSLPIGEITLRFVCLKRRGHPKLSKNKHHTHRNLDGGDVTGNRGLEHGEEGLNLEPSPIT